MTDLPDIPIINGYEHEQLIAKYTELQQVANESYSKCVMLLDRVHMLEAALKEYLWSSVDERLPNDTEVYEWLKKDSKVIFGYPQAMATDSPEDKKEYIKGLGYTHWRPTHFAIAERNGCEDHLTCYGCQDKMCSKYREPNKEKTLSIKSPKSATETAWDDLTKVDEKGKGV